MEPHPFNRAAVMKRSSPQEPANLGLPRPRHRSAAEPLTAYIKDGHSLRVGGHAGGAAIPGSQTHLPPAGTFTAKLGSLLFHQKPASAMLVQCGGKLGSDYRQQSKRAPSQGRSEAFKSYMMLSGFYRMMDRSS